MFLWMNVFTLSVNIRLACDSQRHGRLLRIRYWFTSNHIPFRSSCRPREASRLEAKPHEAEATTHEAEAKAEATTHEAEAKAEARFFGLEAEARPRGLTSLLFISPIANVINPDQSNQNNTVSFHQYADDTQLYI